jgi:hypothetical protein
MQSVKQKRWIGEGPNKELAFVEVSVEDAIRAEPCICPHPECGWPVQLMKASRDRPAHAQHKRGFKKEGRVCPLSCYL